MITGISASNSSGGSPRCTTGSSVSPKAITKVTPSSVSAMVPSITLPCMRNRSAPSSSRCATASSTL